MPRKYTYTPRKHQHNPEERIAAFWAHVDITGGFDTCWACNYAKDRRGYAVVRVNGRLEGAHRYAWQLTNGSIPPRTEVCHRCDNPPCCNPSHLFLGTHQDNMQDAGRKGRVHPPIHRGVAHHLAKLTDADVILIRALHAEGLGSRAITRRYYVSHTTIQQIIQRTTWTHI